MKVTTARELLEAEARRLDLLHRTVDADHRIEVADAEARPVSEAQGADAAARTLELEVGVSLRATVTAECAALVAALERLQLGTYGRCTACGAVVPDERLTELPTTPFCVACEAAGERSPAAAATMRPRALDDLGPGADDDSDDEVREQPAEEAAVRSRRPA